MLTACPSNSYTVTVVRMLDISASADFTFHLCNQELLSLPLSLSISGANKLYGCSPASVEMVRLAHYSCVWMGLLNTLLLCMDGSVRHTTPLYGWVCSTHYSLVWMGLFDTLLLGMDGSGRRTTPVYGSVPGKRSSPRTSGCRFSFGIWTANSVSRLASGISCNKRDSSSREYSSTINGTAWALCIPRP